MKENWKCKIEETGQEFQRQDSPSDYKRWERDSQALKMR